MKKALNSRRNFELAAVKIVDRIRAPRDYQEKFMPRELALWPLLSHPNLIRFTDCFEDSSRVYMVGLGPRLSSHCIRFHQSTKYHEKPITKVCFNQIVMHFFDDRLFSMNIN